MEYFVSVFSMFLFNWRKNLRNAGMSFWPLSTQASCFGSTALQNGDTLSLCYQEVLLVWNHVCNYVFIQFIK